MSGDGYASSRAQGRSLAELDTILAAARDAGLDPDEVKAQTDEALARGITGIPTVAIGNELFWGDDHLEEAAAAASG